jgi:hypothetical protein
MLFLTIDWQNIYFGYNKNGEKTCVLIAVLAFLILVHVIISLLGTV